MAETPEWAAKMLVAMTNMSSVSGPPWQGQQGGQPRWGQGKAQKGWQNAGKGKGAGKGGPAGAGAGQKVWACSCGFNANFASRLNCYICRAPCPFDLPREGSAAPRSPTPLTFGSVAKGKGLEEFGFGPDQQQKEAAKPGLGQPVTGQEQGTPPVSASVEPKPGQLWPKPGEDGATPIGPSSSSPDLDKAFKAQVDRVEAARQRLTKAKTTLDAVQVTYDRAATLAEAAKSKCEEAVEQHSHLEEMWGSEQQKLDELRHRFAHNGGLGKMCGIQKAAGGVLEAILSMAAGNGTNGIPQSMQEGFKILMQKADTLHEYCVAGDVARAPRTAPGPVPVPVQQWMLPTSPKRARDPSDTDPCQSKSESEQDAALREGGDAHPDGVRGHGAPVEPPGQPLEEEEAEDQEGNKQMSDEDGFVENRGRRRGRSRRAAAKAKLEPDRKVPARDASEEKGKVAQPDLKDFFQGRAAQRAAVEPAPGSKEAKKAAKEAAKQAARDRAKVKKQAKK